MFDAFIHKWLRIPYTLNVRHNQRPKSPRATIIFIHGIGNSGAAWNKVITRLPDDIRIITIDLLGFGDSPRPSWAKYNVRTQARSLLRTLSLYMLPGKVIIVGHSLGALVAIEAAKRYPLFTRALVLCSPPVYRQTPTRMLPSSDTILRELYRAALNNPASLAKITSFATKYKLVNETFNVTAENLDTYVATLESAIIDQTAYDDLERLMTQTTIIRGTFDPFVIGKNLKRLGKVNDNIKYASVLAGHEVEGAFINKVVSEINKIYET